ncbi:unnamed protein product [Rotaria magnacalcarata]|uniref:Uncharacterized protein n=1 Tax=Rotaria magnacalcarata TaxID=392030 RepID=A0A819Y842_9BILA|nr:unnamed protein product [Rotaria magnacalcarata]
MTTPTIYNKQQLSKMIENKNPTVSFVKPKHTKSNKWDNYLQIFVNDCAQHFISCLKCHSILAWKPNDGTNVMEKHNKAFEVLIKTTRPLGSAAAIDDLIPDPTTISKEIDKIYNLCKERLMSYLTTINHFVFTQDPSLGMTHLGTVDFWSESKIKIHYGGVILHTYSEKHGLLVFVLACKPYDLAKQSADNIRLFTELYRLAHKE